MYAIILKIMSWFKYVHKFGQNHHCFRWLPSKLYRTIYLHLTNINEVIGIFLCRAINCYCSFHEIAVEARWFLTKILCLNRGKKQLCWYLNTDFYLLWNKNAGRFLCILCNTLEINAFSYTRSRKVRAASIGIEAHMYSWVSPVIQLLNRVLKHGELWQGNVPLWMKDLLVGIHIHDTEMKVCTLGINKWISWSAILQTNNGQKEATDGNLPQPSCSEYNSWNIMYHAVPINVKLNDLTVTYFGKLLYLIWTGQPPENLIGKLGRHKLLKD